MNKQNYNPWLKARITAGRPLVCACVAYIWLHRTGYGRCSIGRPK